MSVWDFGFLGFVTRLGFVGTTFFTSLDVDGLLIKSEMLVSLDVDGPSVSLVALSKSFLKFVFLKYFKLSSWLTSSVILFFFAAGSPLSSVFLVKNLLTISL